MAVRIRLRRVGRKAQPYYRVVVAESTTPRDGYYLDTVGFYNPRTSPAQLRMDLDKVDAWVARGAGLSQTVASLVRKARVGGDRKVAMMEAGAPSSPAPVPAPAPAAAAAPEPVAEPVVEPVAEPVAEAARPAESEPAEPVAGEPAEAEPAEAEPAEARPAEGA